MGRVFSFKQIKKCEIPGPAAFLAVVAQIRDEFTKCEGIIGGIVCGSVLFNLQSVRSDVDVLALYDWGKFNEVQYLFQQLVQNAWKFHVPVKFIGIDEVLARTSLHHIGPSFADHLRRAAKPEYGGLIKKNPLDILFFNPANAQEDMRSYIRNKARMLEDGVKELPIMDESQRCRFL